MLSQCREKIKLLWKDVAAHHIAAIFLFLAIFGMAGVIRVITILPYRQAIYIEKGTAQKPLASKKMLLPYVASVRGKTYQRTDCRGAKQIREENKIFFESTREAEIAGYVPAKNCPGL